MSPIANMLVQIRNAQALGREEVLVPSSKIKRAIAEILKDKGFLSGIEKKKKKAKKAELEYLALKLKYAADGQGAISQTKMISKPSRRVYAPASGMKRILSGYGIAIVSTSRGLMTSEDAKKAGIGGEIICEIF